MRRWGGPALLGLAVAGGLALCGQPPDAGLTWRVAYVALHVGGFVLLVRWLSKNSQIHSGQVLLYALVLRVAVFPMQPSLSDDAFRYVWDGLVVVEGYGSPFDYRPSDVALAEGEGEELFRQMNSPSYYSVYPPASQVVFWAAGAVYSLHGWQLAWWTLKGLLTLAELGGIVLLMRAVPSRLVALYAWSPLAVIEIAGQGHTEALVILGLGLALSASSRIPYLSLGVVIAGLTKLYPLALLPLALRRDGRTGTMWAVGLAACLTLPFASPDALNHIRESLGLFAGTLDMFSLPYLALKGMVYPLAGSASGRIASGVLVAIWWAIVIGVVASDDGTNRYNHVGTVVIIVSALAATPTLHPWYLLPALFVIAAISKPDWAIRGVVAISALAPVSYVIIARPELGFLLTAASWIGIIVYAVWGQGATAFRTDAGVADDASSQIASS